MSADTFAFMIHPIEPKKDVARRFPLLGRLPAAVIDYFSSFFPPLCLSHVTGIRSALTGKEIDGWLVACPMTPRRMLQVPLPTAYRKLIQTGRLAERLGARILGLGAFTAIVGDAGVSVARELSIPVTTGNSYTVAVAVEAALEAACRLGRDPARSTAAVVGAYGSTGRACAHLLSKRVGRLVLVGRQRHQLEEVQSQIEQALATGSEASRGEKGPESLAWAVGNSVSEIQLAISDRLEAVRQADIVLTVTSAMEPIIGPEHLKAGAVVCDVARPRNVSRSVAECREDVLVVEGGAVEVPGEVDFGFDFGFPTGQAYACMAETMVLAMESRYESYSLGRELSLDRVAEITRLAHKHGFRLSGLRSFEQVVGEEMIEKVRRYQKRLSRDQAHPPRDAGRWKSLSAGTKISAGYQATRARPT